MRGFPIHLLRGASTFALFVVSGTAEANDGAADRLIANLAQTPIEQAANASDNAASLSLTDALSLAYRTSPVLAAERRRTDASGYRIAVVEGQAGPTLTFEGRYGYQDDSFDMPVGDPTKLSGWSSTASAILTQPLFTFGRLGSDVNAAKAQAEYSSAVLASTENQTLLNAFTAYVALVRDRMGEQIALEYVNTLQRELSDNIERYRRREVTQSDVHQAKTRLELGREQLLNARRLLSGSEAQFIATIGAKPNKLTAINPLVIPVQSLAEAYEIGEQNAPVLAAAYAREKTSRYQLASTRADFLPRVDLRGTAEYGATTPYSDNLRQRRLMGEVVVSGVLYNGGQRMARLNEAEALNDADWRLIDAALRDNKVQIVEAWNLWQTQSAAATRLALAIDDAQIAYDGAVMQERLGLRTTLEVLDLARDLLNAKTNHNAATAFAYIGQARLLAAMGLLTADNLLADDPAVTELRTERHGKRRDSIRILGPAVAELDAIFVGKGARRKSRDDAGHLQTSPASTALDLNSGLEIPKD